MATTNYSPYGANYDQNIAGAQLAWNNALGQFNAQRKNTLNEYGFNDSQNVNYADPTSMTGNKTQLSSGNPYGRWQQQFSQQGQQLLGLQDNFAERGLGRSGVAGNAFGQAKFGFLGDRANLVSGMTNQLDSITNAYSAGDIANTNYRNSQLQDKARDEDAWLAAHPVAPPPVTETDSAQARTPYTQDQAKAAAINSANINGGWADAVHELELAYEDNKWSGNEALLNQIKAAITTLVAKSNQAAAQAASAAPTVPDFRSRMPWQWAQAQPKETAGSSKTVKPDPYKRR